jgi:hypothetical protein
VIDEWYTDYPWEKALSRLIAREQITSPLSLKCPAAAPESGAGALLVFIAATR